MSQPELLEIENEIAAIAELEGTSSVTDLPEAVTRTVNLYDETVGHTDSGVDVDVVVDVDVDVDIVVVDIDVDIDVDVDVDTHVDKD